MVIVHSFLYVCQRVNLHFPMGFPCWDTSHHAPYLHLHHGLVRQQHRAWHPACQKNTQERQLTKAAWCHGAPWKKHRKFMQRIWKNYETTWVLDMFMGQIMEHVVHVCYIYFCIYIYTPTFTPNMAPNVGKTSHTWNICSCIYHKNIGPWLRIHNEVWVSHKWPKT